MAVEVGVPCNVDKKAWQNVTAQLSDACSAAMSSTLQEGDSQVRSGACRVSVRGYVARTLQTDVSW